jgi:hypothetical protein
MWIGKNAIYDPSGFQVAEVLAAKDSLVVRNLRPNGTVGICFAGEGKAVRDWLDAHIPGWTRSAWTI